MTSIQLKTPTSGEYTQPTGLFINNEWVKGVDGKTFEVINPTNEEVICSVHEATEKDVDIAVQAARKAFDGEWKHTTPEKRGRLLCKLADLVEQNLDLLPSVESLDNGKAISMAKGDVAMVAACLRYYGGWADKVEGKVIDTEPDMFHTQELSRLVSVVKLSHGTSRCSCGHGRSVLQSQLVTPLFSRLLNKPHFPHSLPPT